ncbi:MAG: carbamoyltransferase HypF, partial [Bacillota bacterium]|nr:carbamoyltransferase HypF [Bacillota bacterium]
GDETYHKDDAFKKAQEFLNNENIIAVNGLGGMHLACDADNIDLVNELRKRKHRDEKPFALMVKSLEAVKEICEVTPEEEKILTSHQRTIALLKKKDVNSLWHISENNYIGAMLPYTPVHFLLFDGAPERLVMTSANISDLPIIYQNDEALEKLKDVADGFLLNNRDIETRCDDSLCWVFEGKEYFARRSRGFVPFPIILKNIMENTPNKENVLACGAEQKATFAISKNTYVFPSAHIGDLKNIETLEHYENQIKHFEKMFSIEPKIIACDLHPDYLSTNYAKQRAQKENLKLVRIQHHFAHMASCMADNNLDEKVIGIIWDGTGLGTDNTIWGAEFLTGDFEGFERKGTIMPFKLPGGDKATEEIYRCAASLLKTSGIDIKENYGQIDSMMDADINCPTCTSMGRLFDGVAYLIGIKEVATYEGQAAVLLEAKGTRAKESTNEIYDYDIIKTDKYYFDFSKMIKEIINEKGKVEVETQALKFMNTMVDMAVEISKKIRKDTNLNKVVLSGGTMQNQYMLGRLIKRLKEEGFEPYHHKRVSANDEGLALGQVMIATRSK